MLKAAKGSYMKISKFDRSQKAHRVLAERNRKKALFEKSDSLSNFYYLKSCYHSDVIDCQSRIGRVLTKPERKKAFSIEKKHGGNVDFHALFKK